MPRLRIEVLKRVLHEDLIREKLPEAVVPHVPICPEVEEGQVFIAESLDHMPEGFCEAAWTDIVNKIAPQLAEAPDNAGAFFLSCMDGLRPVTFEVTPLPRSSGDTYPISGASRAGSPGRETGQMLEPAKEGRGHKP